ncbi:unnamed protein product, partial [Staurois parvus]
MDGMTDPDPSGMDGQLSGVGERGTGGVSERMVGVTSQVQQVAGSAVQRVRQKDGQGRAGVRAGEGQHKQNRQSLATRKRTYRTG